MMNILNGTDIWWIDGIIFLIAFALMILIGYIIDNLLCAIIDAIQRRYKKYHRRNKRR
jgi:hypothetical protein